MGEYATAKNHNGAIVTVLKLGVLDHMMYVRRSELEAWAPHDLGHGTDCGAILADPTTRYRFPWPYEDGCSIKAHPEIIKARPPFPVQSVPWPGVRGAAHQSCIAYVNTVAPDPQMESGRVSGSVRIPCPLSPAPTLEILHAPELVCIVGERWLAGRPWTVFECAYCRSPFRVTHEEAEQIKAALLLADPSMTETARRIKGYTL